MSGALFTHHRLDILLINDLSDTYHYPYTSVLSIMCENNMGSIFRNPRSLLTGHLFLFIRRQCLAYQEFFVQMYSWETYTVVVNWWEANHTKVMFDTCFWQILMANWQVDVFTLTIVSFFFYIILRITSSKTELQWQVNEWHIAATTITNDISCDSCLPK